MDKLSNMKNILPVNAGLLLCIFIVAVRVTAQGQAPVFTAPPPPEPFDVSSMVHAGVEEEFSLLDQESSPTALSFNTDGSKLFILGTIGIPVVEYSLTTPFDVSTAVYAGAAEEFSVSTQENSPTGLAFSTDGSKLFIIGTAGDAVVEYTLITPFDVSTAVYAGAAEEFSVAAQETSPQDLAFSTDGSKMFVIGSFDDAVVEYTLITPFDVSTAVYAGAAEEFSIAAQESFPTGLAFNTAGSKLFIIGVDDDAVVEYTLSTPFDVSTAVYAGAAEEFSMNAQEKTPSSLAFTTDGSKLFIAGTSGFAVVEYDLESVISYAENSTALVIDVDANDGAGGATDTSVNYSLSGPDAALFVINANGVITFNTSPNFEAPVDADEDNAYDITIVAANTTDMAELRIIVSITNVADTPIFINASPSSIDYAENSTALVIDVDANDGAGGTAGGERSMRTSDGLCMDAQGTNSSSYTSTQRCWASSVVFWSTFRGDDASACTCMVTVLEPASRSHDNASAQ